jgi:hypothetical protein
VLSFWAKVTSGTIQLGVRTEVDSGTYFVYQNVAVADNGDTWRYYQKTLTITEAISTVDVYMTHTVQGISYIDDLVFAELDAWNSTSFIVTSDGLVGIGVNSPSEELEIASGAPEIRFNDTGNAYNFFDIGVAGDDFKIYLNDSSEDGITINQDGNVGIGTATPSSILEILDTTPVLSLNDSRGGMSGTNLFGIGNIAFAGSDPSIAAGGIYASIEAHVVDVNSEIQGSQDEGGALSFNVWRHNTGSAPRIKNRAMFIDNFGNVGIGTASPNSKLEIAGSEPHIQLDMGNTGAQNVTDQSDADVRMVPISTGGTAGTALTVLNITAFASGPGQGFIAFINIRDHSDGAVRNVQVAGTIEATNNGQDANVATTTLVSQGSITTGTFAMSEDVADTMQALTYTPYGDSQSIAGIAFVYT